MKVISYLNSLTRQQQIIFILTLSLLVLIVLSFFLNFIQKTANNLEIERNKILTEERLINKINFFPGFVNQDNVSIYESPSDSYNLLNFELVFNPLKNMTIVSGNFAIHRFRNRLHD